MLPLRSLATVLLAAPLTALCACIPGPRVARATHETPCSPRADSAAAFAAAADAFVGAALDSIGVVPGLAVAVVRGDEVAYLRGVGTADREAGVSVTPETVFYTASVTKGFTALAAVLLDARGTIDLDAPLDRYFPDVAFDAAAADSVTLRDLLTHTHGLLNDGVVFRTAYSGEHTPDGLRALLAATTSAEAPRGAFAYTNLGYNVLSLLLDREMGRPWQTVHDSLVFTPLGMDRTTAYASEAAREQWPTAAPYEAYSAGGVERVTLVKVDETMHAAGGTLSTAADLARWVEAQLNGGRVDGRQVFPEAAIHETHRLTTTTDDEFGPFHRSGYGLGWYVGDYDGDTLMQDFGGFAGFHAHVSFMPEHRVGVVVLVNEGRAGDDLANLIATFAYDWWRGRPDATARAEEGRASLARAVAERRTRVAAERAERDARPWTLSRPMAAYAGTYVSPLYGTAVVSTEGEALVVEIGRLRAVATPSTEPDAVRVELVPGRGELIAFGVLGEGAVSTLRYGDVTFERTPR